MNSKKLRDELLSSLLEGHSDEDSIFSKEITTKRLTSHERADLFNEPVVFKKPAISGDYFTDLDLSSSFEYLIISKKQLNYILSLAIGSALSSAVNISVYYIAPAAHSALFAFMGLASLNPVLVFSLFCVATALILSVASNVALSKYNGETQNNASVMKLS